MADLRSAVMSDIPDEPGSWQASDGKWYPADQFPGTASEGGAPAAPDPAPGGQPGPPPAPGAPPGGPGGQPGPGWWMASDGNWYPPDQAPGYGGHPSYSAYDPQAKSKIAAGLFGIFLGGFGVHRFYLGYTQIGVIQIVVTIFTCGFGSLWGFIEGILILVGHESFRTDADGRPLRE